MNTHLILIASVLLMSLFTSAPIAQDKKEAMPPDDAKALGILPPAGAPVTIQERAWASPIWYTPDPSAATKAV